MTEGKEGYQPSEEEMKAAEKHMTEKEAIMSEVREETHEFRNTGRSNMTEIRTEEAKKKGREEQEQEIETLARSVSRKVESFIKNPEDNSLGFPFIEGQIEKYTEWAGGPEVWLRIIGEKAGLGNSDISSGVLGEKDGVRVKSEIRYSGMGTGIHFKLEKI